MSRFHTIRDDVAELASKVSEGCRRDLPLVPCTLSGEVLDVWRRGDRWEMTLRDIKEEERAMTARLPGSEPKPTIGYTIGIVGRYTVELDPIDASFRLLFDGTARDPNWTPRQSIRQRERRELIAKLHADLQSPARLQGQATLKVALVTSRGSTATEDFKAGLGHLQEAVTCREELIPLEQGTATDIALGIRRAGKLGADLIVIARGGGRQVMLQRFSSDEVIRAVAEVAVEVPVLVAIGHKRDRVAAEEFAWDRASTPSEAGARVAREIALHRWREKKDRERFDRENSATPEFQSGLMGVPAAIPFAPNRNGWRAKQRQRRPFASRLLIWLLLFGGLALYGWYRCQDNLGTDLSSQPPAVHAPDGLGRATPDRGAREDDSASRRRARKASGGAR